MADDEEQQELETQVPEMWLLAKPPADEDEEEETTRRKPAPGAKVGKLVKLLNDIEDPEELDQKVIERDPASGQTLLMWATLQNKFVLVEWLIKKCGRASFAFNNNGKEIEVFDKWIEIRKELEEKEKERLANPPEEEPEDEEDEEKEPEPTADQLVFEALAEYHEEWGNRGPGICKAIGELGVYQGARNAEGTKQGLGQSLFPNSDMYVGEYKDNQRNGTGTYNWFNEAMVYIGQWLNNVRHGVGRMVYPDGGRYYGAWEKDKRSGEGRYTYPDGGSYSGAWVEDQKHGFGTFTFPDGNQYVGTFVEGEFVSGEWRLAGGTRYYGSFSAGAPVGKGLFVFKYGQEGSYRQEGVYANGTWRPGATTTVESTPRLQIVVQEKPITLQFSSECAGLNTEAMVGVANFGPFVEWLRKLESSTAVFVDEIVITGVGFDAKDKSVSDVRLSLKAVNGAGERIKNTDGIVLKRASSRVLIVLSGGDKTLAILQQSPAPAMLAPELLQLPIVNVTSTGAIRGPFVELVASALRLDVNKSNTIALSGPTLTNAAFSDARVDVLCYMQAIHPDAMATLQTRLDAANAGREFGKPRAVRLSEVATLSSDAVTVAAALRLAALTAEGKVPDATVAPQRPPTPIPPAAEPRPDIQPLLEAERKEQEAKRAAEEDEDE